MVRSILHTLMHVLSFRPLTGMVPKFTTVVELISGFRPLTGMVPGERETVMKTMKFSPPYGENPLSHGLRRASSPERGSLVQGKWRLQKLPLSGELARSA